VDIDTLIIQGQLLFWRIPFLWHVFSAHSQIIEGDLCITKGAAMVASELLGGTIALAESTKQRLISIINQKSADVKRSIPAKGCIHIIHKIRYFKKRTHLGATAIKVCPLGRSLHVGLRWGPCGHLRWLDLFVPGKTD
jgi:hypothetical protein